MWMERAGGGRGGEQGLPRPPGKGAGPAGKRTLHTRNPAQRTIERADPDGLRRKRKLKR